MAKAGRPTNEEPTVQTHIRLSAQLKRKADKRAKEIGVGYQEYVRQLITIDTRDVKLE